MKIEENKYTVLKGPTAIIENRLSASSSIVNLRQSLIDIGVLKQNIDQKFTSLQVIISLIILVMQQQ